MDRAEWVCVKGLLTYYGVVINVTHMKTQHWITIWGIAIGLFLTTIGGVWNLSHQIASISEKLTSIDKRLTKLENNFKEMQDDFEVMQAKITEMSIKLSEMTIKVDLCGKTMQRKPIHLRH